MKMYNPAKTQYMPRNGYQGWICNACGAKAQRSPTIPHTFICRRPECEYQYATWVDEVQD